MRSSGDFRKSAEKMWKNRRRSVIARSINNKFILPWAINIPEQKAAQFLGRFASFLLGKSVPTTHYARHRSSTQRGELGENLCPRLPSSRPFRLVSSRLVYGHPDRTRRAQATCARTLLPCDSFKLFPFKTSSLRPDVN